MEYPNLAGIATADLVEKIGTAKFSASYINWSRTMYLLRENAPGWLPVLAPAPDGGVVHRAPVGGFLLIGFAHVDGQTTAPVPQAIMDNNNNSVPWDRISARDITDSHRRGVCMAAALTFGLAYELWAKLPLENGYAGETKPETKPEPQQGADVRQLTVMANGTDGVWAALKADQREKVEKVAAIIQEYLDVDDVPGAVNYYDRADFGAEEKTALWTMFKSYEKSAMKMAHEGDPEGGIDHLIRNRNKQAAKAAKEAA